MSNPLIITQMKNIDFFVEEQMQEINIKTDNNFRAQGRNTAPAIALAAIQATSNGENPYLLILSSDHFIQKQSGI